MKHLVQKSIKTELRLKSKRRQEVGGAGAPGGERADARAILLSKVRC
jgi:hypothetical protein